MTTPLFLLRCVQLGISMADMELLSIGLVNDMFVESRNDECRYAEIGTQEDMDRFCNLIDMAAFFCYNLVVEKG